MLGLSYFEQHLRALRWVYITMSPREATFGIHPAEQFRGLLVLISEWGAFFLSKYP